MIDWGAMQFLLGSLVNRKRRILVEELILMALRCLLIAVLVLAIARPFAPVNSPIPWLLLLPIILIASVVVSVAAIVARRRSWRWLLYLCAVGLVVGVVYLSQNQHLLQAALWKSSTEQDIAVVIDGSSSMRVEVDGKTGFEHAVAEARRLVESLGPDDTISVVVAGSVTKTATPQPLNVRGNVDDVLRALAPVGGSLNVVDGLSAAVSCLAMGENASKKIVLISDGQNVGWDEDNPGRWEFLAETLNRLPTRPKVISRFVALPNQFQNAAISSVELSRNLIGTDREVTIRVRVENTGFEAIEVSGMQLQFDGDKVITSDVGEIEAGESTQLNLKHRFQTGGSHIVEAKLLINDDLAEDNQRFQVVHVIETLPVLLVDGSAQVRAVDQATGFIEVALAPPADDGPAGDKPAGDKPSEAGDPSKPLVVTTVIAAPDLGPGVRFGDYRVVMLVDVPRLGASAATRLANFVRQGGGLLIAPGSRCETEFYNDWKLPDGRNLVPARIGQRVIIEEGQQTTRPMEDSFDHPALARLLAASQTDIAKAVITTYWQLEPHRSAPDAIVGAKLDGGDPFLVQQTVDRGLVAVTATSLDGRGSDFPTLVSFLPFIHELTYDLASTASVDLNRQPSSVLTIDLRLSDDLPLSEGGAGGAAPSDQPTDKLRQSLSVTLPDGESRIATLESDGSHASISLSGAVEPGVYRIELDRELARRLGASVVREGDQAYLPVAVGVSDIESRLAPLTDQQEAVASRNLDYFRATDSEQMVAAVIGDIPGHELWKYLVIVAVVILLAESFVARWIAQQRKTGTTQTVAFVSEGERLSTFQQRARELLEAVRTR